MSVDTVLITGACGQVGRRCTEILLSRGRTVIAVDLHNEKNVETVETIAATAERGKLVPVFADLLDAEAISSTITEHRPGAIVHLAAMLAPVSYRNPRLARKVNVGGTRNIIQAAEALPRRPLLVYASSASVYGSVNPYRHPGRITAASPVNPIDQYGEDKVLCEKAITESQVPHAVLRLGGVISPDGAANFNGDYLTLMRATPRDNRIHAVDARDVALAFANAVDREDAIDHKVLLIAGNETYARLQHELEDDLMAAAGIGGLGPSAGLPGDPDDDRGWSFTGWFDTTESQALLHFQEHDWADTVAWVADAQGRRRELLRVLGPIIRPCLRGILAIQRHREHRGKYADPWTVIARKYGPDVLAPTNF